MKLASQLLLNKHALTFVLMWKAVLSGVDRLPLITDDVAARLLRSCHVSSDVWRLITSPLMSSAAPVSHSHEFEGRHSRRAAASTRSGTGDASISAQVAHEAITVKGDLPKLMPSSAAAAGASQAPSVPPSATLPFRAAMVCMDTLF